MIMEPKIRLKGFSGEWENTPFLETFDFIKNNSLSRDMLSQEGEVQNIHYGDVLIKYGECVDSNIDDIPFVKDNETAKVLLRTGSLQNGDVVIADAAEDNSVGKCSEIVCDSTAQMVSGLHTIPVRPKSEFASRYLGYYMNSPAYHNQLLPHIQGSKISSISKKAVGSTNIAYPSSKDEQRALASFFTSLDNQISAAEKRLASLKQVKAASLQAMFPQEGETTPKLRFKECDGEWKKVKLGEMYEPRNEKNDLSFGVNDIISVANMYFRPISYVSNDDYLKSYNIFRVGDIAFEGNKSKNFSHGRFVENSIGDGIVSHVFVVLKRKDKQFDVDFWKYYINNERIMCGILTRSTKSSTMMSDIVVSDFLKESILVPSYEEQVKIGNYFTTLDRQISSQSSKISKLKQIKSACLDQMFV